jgi:hypothetical protein
MLAIGAKGGAVMQRNTDFLKAVMKKAHLRSLKQAEEAVNAVLSLTKAKVGAKVSRKDTKVASSRPRKSREPIVSEQLDDYEIDERLFEIGEVEE